MVQEAEAPGRWEKLVPSSEKKEVKLQGPVTSSDIGEIVCSLGQLASGYLSIMSSS